MLSEEEMRAIDFLKGVCTDDCVNKEFVVKPILYLIENQQKELNSLKEIEQLHQEENGKLRVELEQYKLLEANIDKANRIIAENKFDEGLYGLLMQEKEKNKELKKYEEAYKLLSYALNNYISKDKIKAEMEDIIDYFEYANATSEDMEFLEKKKKEILEEK